MSTLSFIKCNIFCSEQRKKLCLLEITRGDRQFEPWIPLRDKKKSQTWGSICVYYTSNICCHKQTLFLHLHHLYSHRYQKQTKTYRRRALSLTGTSVAVPATSLSSMLQQQRRQFGFDGLMWGISLPEAIKISCGCQWDFFHIQTQGHNFFFLIFFLSNISARCKSDCRYISLCEVVVCLCVKPQSGSDLFCEAWMFSYVY